MELKLIWEIVWLFCVAHSINLIILLLLLNWLWSIFHFLQKPLLCHCQYKSLLKILVQMSNPLNVRDMARLHCFSQGRCARLLTPFDQLKHSLCYSWMFKHPQSCQVCQLLLNSWSLFGCLQWFWNLSELSLLILK